MNSEEEEEKEGGREKKITNRQTKRKDKRGDFSNQKYT